MMMSSHSPQLSEGQESDRELQKQERTTTILSVLHKIRNTENLMRMMNFLLTRRMMRYCSPVSKFLIENHPKQPGKAVTFLSFLKTLLVVTKMSRSHQPVILITSNKDKMEVTLPSKGLMAYIIKVYLQKMMAL
jgi:hypothetical protein